MYFQTDPALSADRVLAWGRRLRAEFYLRLPEFAAALDPVDDPGFRPLHADFFSRLALTFDRGDYARVDAIPGKEPLAEALYRRALGYHPDRRAFLGLGMLLQRNRRYAESAAPLREGVDRHPDDAELAVCFAVTLLNLGRAAEARRLLRRFPEHPGARELARSAGMH